MINFIPLSYFFYKETTREFGGEIGVVEIAGT